MKRALVLIASIAPAIAVPQEVPEKVYNAACSGPGGHGDTPLCRACANVGFPAIQACITECPGRAKGDDYRLEICLRACGERFYNFVGHCVDANPPNR